LARFAIGWLAVAGVALASGCGGSSTGTATARCAGPTAELEFVPSESVRVDANGATNAGVVAKVDTGSRRVDFPACARVRTQGGWHTNRRIYREVQEAALLLCRFRGGFFIHVHPTSSSQAGDAYDGSALYLVIGKQPTIVASAVVGRHGSELLFSPRYCRRAGRV
jgi:hypothetical protein